MNQITHFGSPADIPACPEKTLALSQTSSRHSKARVNRSRASAPNSGLTLPGPACSTPFCVPPDFCRVWALPGCLPVPRHSGIFHQNHSFLAAIPQISLKNKSGILQPHRLATIPSADWFHESNGCVFNFLAPSPFHQNSRHSIGIRPQFHTFRKKLRYSCHLISIHYSRRQSAF